MVINYFLYIYCWNSKIRLQCSLSQVNTVPLRKMYTIIVRKRLIKLYLLLINYNTIVIINCIVTIAVILKRSYHSVLPSHFNHEFVGPKKLSTRQVLRRGQIVHGARHFVNLKPHPKSSTYLRFCSMNTCWFELTLPMKKIFLFANNLLHKFSNIFIRFYRNNLKWIKYPANSVSL